jgi:hypothetical protein
MLPPPPAEPPGSPNPPLPKPAVPSVPASPQAPAGFASLIVADFPALFAEFGGKRFTLLWRGSRDGFRAKNFHGRCDGHANTLTLILDTEGNIFGGFTPLEWESRKYDRESSRALLRDNCLKPDPSVKSFLFTLKHPHNFPARKFALKAERKDEANEITLLHKSASVPVILDRSAQLASDGQLLHEIEVDDRRSGFKTLEASKSGRELLRVIEQAQRRTRASKSNNWIGFEDICVCPVGSLPL